MPAAQTNLSDCGDGTTTGLCAYSKPMQHGQTGDEHLVIAGISERYGYFSRATKGSATLVNDLDQDGYERMDQMIVNILI